MLRIVENELQLGERFLGEGRTQDMDMDLGLTSKLLFGLEQVTDFPSLVFGVPLVKQRDGTN